MFDVGGTSLGSFGSSGRAAGQFIRPLGVGADASGMRAVADSVNGRILLLNPDGSVAAMFGAPAPGPTLLPDPVAVAFDAAGLLYVLDQERSRVLVFDRGGKIIRTIGSRGRGAGQAAVAVRGRGLRRRARLRRRHGQRADRALHAPAARHLGSFGRFRTIRGIAVSPDGSRVYGVRRGAQPDHGLDRLRRRPGRDRRGARLGELRSPAGSRVDARRATCGSPTAATTACGASPPTARW